MKVQIRKFHQRKTHQQKIHLQKLRLPARSVRYLAMGAGSLLFAAQVFASTVININTADAETIAEGLQGIGPVKAQAIVDYREANGLFKTPSDIMNVTGIGKATFEVLKSYLIIGTPASEASSAATPLLKPGLKPESTAGVAKAVAKN